MIDLPRIHAEYQRELDDAITQVVHSGQYIGGPKVKEFETAFSAFLGAEVTGVGNGTDALQIALMALGIGPGDEVIVPAFTYAASAEVIGLLGAKAVWCDVDSNDFCIDAQSVAERLTPKTKAIIVVHLYGQCADIEAVEHVAPNIPIVEDTAQAFGARFTTGKYAGSFAGTVGTFGTFSFFPTKSLGALGDGGAICSRNQKLLALASSIAKHGQREKYSHEILGVNSRLDPIQAAVLLVKLNYFNLSISRKNALASLYENYLQHVRQVDLPKKNAWSAHIYHQFTIKVPLEHRDALRSYLKSKGISTMIYYPKPLHLQTAYAHFDPSADVPVSTKLSQTVLSLPIDELLQEEELRYITTTIESYFAL